MRVRINSPHGKWQSICKIADIKALRPVSIVDMGAYFGYLNLFFHSGQKPTTTRMAP
jgi:hypothetical protein